MPHSPHNPTRRSPRAQTPAVDLNATRRRIGLKYQPPRHDPTPVLTARPGHCAASTRILTAHPPTLCKINIIGVYFHRGRPIYRRARSTSAPPGQPLLARSTRLVPGTVPSGPAAHRPPSPRAISPRVQDLCHCDCDNVTNFDTSPSRLWLLARAGFKRIRPICGPSARGKL